MRLSGVCAVVVLLFASGCMDRQATPQSCRRMTCPAPAKPILMYCYKCRNVCVCAPPEEFDAEGERAR